MPAADPWTIGRLLTWTTDYLKQRGADSPRLDAEVLLAHACDCPRIELYTSYDEPADDAARTAFRELVRRRSEGTPVAYLVGHREFFSLSFRVTPDVLIPRPETEHLVVSLLDLAKESGGDPALRIADVGTGSGVIAICAAVHVPTCRVTAVDICPKALEVAEANARKHQVADRVEFLQSDLLDAVPADRMFDIIASNPPYLSDEEVGSLARDVRDHEPAVALSAGESNLRVYERLIPQAAERLVPGGWLLAEISPMILAAVENMVGNCPLLDLGPTDRDLSGHARVIHAQRRRNAAT